MKHIKHTLMVMVITTIFRHFALLTMVPLNFIPQNQADWVLVDNTLTLLLLHIVTLVWISKRQRRETAKSL